MNQQTKIKPALNEGQQAAADGCFQFLLGNQKELNITGPGGVGKTFLMSYIIDEVIPRYEETCQLMGIPSIYKEIAMTATTHKAAEVLSIATGRPTQTIHSFLNLQVSDDYKTGQSKLKRKRDWKPRENVILFVDEASMIDTQLYHEIHASTVNCKIIYIGDHCQMAPVMEKTSPIYRNQILTFELTQPVRNSGQPALMNLCNQMRHTVETGEFLPIQLVPGVIELFDDEQLEQALAKQFTLPNENSRILAYTNERVILYNDHIRSLRGLSDVLDVGEKVITNSALHSSSGILPIEREVLIHDLSDPITQQLCEETSIEYRLGALQYGSGSILMDVKIPKDTLHLRELIKYFGRQKRFDLYYYLKNEFADLRMREAGTVYKAQGSTYDSVFIDLGNIGTSNNPAQVARMLYVAVSRARDKIIFYGKLPAKYGCLLPG